MRFAFILAWSPLGTEVELGRAPLAKKKPGLGSQMVVGEIGVQFRGVSQCRSLTTGASASGSELRC